MPQKRNPMMSEYLVASARLLRGAIDPLANATAHAGERDMGLWAVEWLAVPQAFILAGGVAEKLVELVAALRRRPGTDAGEPRARPTEPSWPKRR